MSARDAEGELPTVSHDDTASSAVTRRDSDEESLDNFEDVEVGVEQDDSEESPSSSALKEDQGAAQVLGKRHEDANSKLPEQHEPASSREDESRISLESSQISRRLSADDSFTSRATVSEPDASFSTVVAPGAHDAKMAVSEADQQGSASPLVMDVGASSADDAEPHEPASLAIPTHRSSVTSQVSYASSTDANDEEKPTIVHGVCLVAFHHTFGPIVEYSYPPELKDDEDIVKNLPFLALPDGAHMVSSGI